MRGDRYFARIIREDQDVNRKQRAAAEAAARRAGVLASDPRVAGLFAAGLAHHQQGRLAQAETHYRETLALQPDHADALHLLGVIASQVGRHDVAVDLIGAGEGEVVLVCRGSAARVVTDTSGVPTDAAIIAVIDTIQLGTSTAYSKS